MELYKNMLQFSSNMLQYSRVIIIRIMLQFSRVSTYILRCRNLVAKMFYSYKNLAINLR